MNPLRVIVMMNQPELPNKEKQSNHLSSTFGRNSNPVVKFGFKITKPIKTDHKFGIGSQQKLQGEEKSIDT